MAGSSSGSGERFDSGEAESLLQQSKTCTLCGVLDPLPSADFPGYADGNVLYRPCLCRKFVHFRCLLLSLKSHRDRCNACGTIYLDSRTEAYGLSDNANVDPEERQKLEALPACSVCRKKVFIDGHGGTKGDHDFIVPCPCGPYAHHGCMSALVLKFPKCPQCGEKYDFYHYGTFVDYLKSNPFVFALALIVYLLLLGASMYVICQWYFMGLGPQWTRARHGLILLIFGLIFVTIITALYSMWLRYTYRVLYARFRQRYGKVTVCSHPQAKLRPNISSFPFSHHAKAQRLRSRQTLELITDPAELDTSHSKSGGDRRSSLERSIDRAICERRICTNGGHTFEVTTYAAKDDAVECSSKL
ncbi:Protein F55A11.7 [Aphelenchoides avenae]|nr:Protein F55A11.7 [Aphelenchus avenae]